VGSAIKIFHVHVRAKILLCQAIYAIGERQKEHLKSKGSSRGA